MMIERVCFTNWLINRQDTLLQGSSNRFQTLSLQIKIDLTTNVQTTLRREQVSQVSKYMVGRGTSDVDESFEMLGEIIQCSHLGTELRP